MYIRKYISFFLVIFLLALSVFSCLDNVDEDEEEDNYSGTCYNMERDACIDLYGQEREVNDSNCDRTISGSTASEEKCDGTKIATCDASARSNFDYYDYFGDEAIGENLRSFCVREGGSWRRAN